MSRIFVLGNSHLRSINNNTLITPFFLGPASQVSLIEKNIKNLYNSLDKFLELKILKEDDIIIIFFGEGLCRYSLKNDFYPHIIPINKYNETYKNEMKHNVNEMISNGIEKYIEIYNYLIKKHSNTYILSATTSFSPIINKILYFNNQIKEKVINYIDTFEDIIDKNYEIKKKYLNYNFINETKHTFYIKNKYEYDPIHLNNNVTDLLIDKIKGQISNINIIKFSSNKFNRDKNYNCYIIK